MADSKKSKAAQKAAATRKANAQARLVVLPVRFFLSDLDVVHMADSAPNRRKKGSQEHGS
jgi:hypothetical protein